MHLCLSVLTYSQAALKSLKISAVILAIDSLGALLLHNYLSPYAVFGDLLLIETAALFIIAGVLDYGSSLAFVHVRRLMSPTREAFSASKRKESERRALVFVSSGGTLFGILILLAILHS